MSTHAEFLIQLADDIKLSHPHNAARLLEVAFDLRQLQSFADTLVGEAISEARRADAEIKAIAATALGNIVQAHRRET